MDCIKPELIENTTLDGRVKYAVVFRVPTSYVFRSFFGLGPEQRIEDDHVSTRYMRVDEDGFAVLRENRSWHQTTEPYWTDSKEVAEKLLAAAQKYRVEPNVLGYDPRYGTA